MTYSFEEEKLLSINKKLSTYLIANKNFADFRSKNPYNCSVKSQND